MITVRVTADGCKEENITVQVKEKKKDEENELCM